MTVVSKLITLLVVALATSVSAKRMLIGYFPNWLYANYPVEQIPYSEYTHINYAFSILNNEDNLPSFPDDWAVENYLPKIVDLAHQAGTKILLSIGGWTGSKRFSPMVASPESRKAFIDWNLNFINTYGIDGVDLDWEYPARQGAGCNEIAPNDSENFILLLQELRQALDENFPDNYKEISMAVHVDPFVGSDGTPMKDVSGYVPVVDHINLMTYDINGAWASETGPNAPFQHEENKGASYSFVKSIRQWKQAGFPAEKITAGLAFYGRSMLTEVDMTLDPTSQYQTAKIGAPKGDSDDAYWSDPYCGADISGTSGVWKWSNLRSEGLISDDMVTTGQGWNRYWDDYAKTPWLFNPQSNIYISYDDPQSLQIKIDHALCEDLAGVMVWDLHQDNGELLRVANGIHADAPSTCPLDENSAEQQKEASSSAAPALSSYMAAPSSSAIKQHQSSIALSSSLPKSSSVANVEDNSNFSSATQPVASSTPSNHAEGSVHSYETGDVCITSGEHRCVQSGVSAEWVTCNTNAWVTRGCSAGLVCYDSINNSIYCDYPI
ncbi:hypothetical protein INT45_009941, partial [Circinella minor]